MAWIGRRASRGCEKRGPRSREGAAPVQPERHATDDFRSSAAKASRSVRRAVALRLGALSARGVCFDAVGNLVIELEGPAITGTRVSAPLLRSLLDTLVDAVQESVRLRAEGRSRASGTRPPWLEPAAGFHVRIAAGSTELHLDAPALGDAAPERFSQPDLFEPIDPRDSCLDLLRESVDDIVNARLDSDRYDDRLVETVEGFGWLFRHGVTSLRIANGAGATDMTEATVGALQELRRQIPPEHRARVAGKLDVLRHGARTFAIELPSGEQVRGLASAQVDLAELGTLWGLPVVAEGTAFFRASGRLLRLDADTIVAAQGNVEVWSRAPRPLFADHDVRALKEPQTARSGVAAIFGRWPGDESDEALDEALRSLS